MRLTKLEDKLIVERYFRHKRVSQIACEENLTTDMVRQVMRRAIQNLYRFYEKRRKNGTLPR